MIERVYSESNNIFQTSLNQLTTGGLDYVKIILIAIAPILAIAIAFYLIKWQAFKSRASDPSEIKFYAAKQRNLILAIFAVAFAGFAVPILISFFSGTFNAIPTS